MSLQLRCWLILSSVSINRCIRARVIGLDLAFLIFVKCPWSRSRDTHSLGVWEPKENNRHLVRWCAAGRVTAAAGGAWPRLLFSRSWAGWECGGQVWRGELDSPRLAGSLKFQLRLLLYWLWVFFLKMTILHHLNRTETFMWLWKCVESQTDPWTGVGGDRRGWGGQSCLVVGSGLREIPTLSPEQNARTCWWAQKCESGLVLGIVSWILTSTQFPY